ncbi:MAG TPA: hypothetical protein V6C65_37930 [Allocoleopsis sp.]
MKLDVKLEIHPYEGIAGIKFGMTPIQVRQILGEPDRTFKKTPADALETDAFDTAGMYIFYKLPGTCEAIELASPANPTFQGKTLISQPFSHLREWFQSIDPTTEIDETGLTSHQLGIGLYAPFAIESPHEAVEGVIVFEQGYYEV